MENINYTFIIPHKNIPDLLQRCLDSIPRRGDIQIIVVDDNSDPEKVDFEHFPGVGEACVEVYFTKEGKGAGYARNVGLRHAKGKWLLFADADDYYIENFIAVLDVYIDSSYQIIYYNVSSNIRGEKDRTAYIAQLYAGYLEGKVDLLEIKFLIWVPWNKMFLTEFIVCNNLQFEEIPVGNDAFFSLLSSLYANRVIVINDRLYCNTYNNNSITFSVRTFNRELDYLDINIKINKFLRCQGLKDRQMCLVSYKILKSLYLRFGLEAIYRYLLVLHKRDSILSALLFWLKLKMNKYKVH